MCGCFSGSGYAKGSPNTHAVASPTLRGQWDLILIALEEEDKKKNSTNKILENIKSSKGFITPNCTSSPDPQRRNADRKQMTLETRWKFAMSEEVNLI